MTSAEANSLPRPEESQTSLGEFARGWPVLLAAIFGAMVGAAGLTSYMIPFFIEPLGAEYGWGRAEITIAATFNSLGVFVASPLMGRFADRIGTQRLVAISVLLFSVGVLSMSLLRPPLWLFYAAYFIVAMLGTGTIYVVTSRALNTWFDKSRGLALGLLTCGPGIAAMIAPQILPEIIDAHGWRAGYLTLGVVAFLALPTTLLFLRERTGTTGSAAPINRVGVPFQDVIRTRQFWAILVGIAFAQVATTGAVVNSIPMFTDLDASPEAARNATSLFGMCMIAGRIATGALLDRVHGAVIGGVFFVAPAVGFASLMFVGEPAIVFYAVTLGMAVGAEGDLVAYLVSRYFGLKSYAETNGWVYGCACLGLALGPLVFAGLYAIGGSYVLPWFAAIVLCLAAALLFATLGRYPKFEDAES